MPELPEALEKLPPFPPVAVRVLQLLTRPEAEPAEVASLIESDPALSAGILTLANSPLFGVTSEIRSISHAIVLLGFERTRTVTSTVAMRAYLEGSRVSGVLRSCWLHSVASAFLAGELAAVSGLEKDHAYTAGLLHDVGRFGLLAAYSRPYEALASKRHEDILRILEEERAIVGVNHCEAGALLARLWTLPGVLVQVAGQHHDREPESRLAALTRVACRLADALRFEAIRYEQVTPFDEICAETPDWLRGRLRFRLEDLEERIIDKIYSLDSL